MTFGLDTLIETMLPATSQTSLTSHLASIIRALCKHNPIFIFVQNPPALCSSSTSTMTFSSAAAAAKESTSWNPRLSLLSSNSVNGLPYLLQDPQQQQSGNPQAPPMLTSAYLYSDGTNHNGRQDLHQILQDVLDILDEDGPLLDDEQQEEATPRGSRSNRSPRARRPRE